jgi:hypothetical protein
MPQGRTRLGRFTSTRKSSGPRVSKSRPTRHQEDCQGNAEQGTETMTGEEDDASEMTSLFVPSSPLVTAAPHPKRRPTESSTTRTSARLHQAEKAARNQENQGSVNAQTPRLLRLRLNPPRKPPKEPSSLLSYPLEEASWSSLSIPAPVPTSTVEDETSIATLTPSGSKPRLAFSPVKKTPVRVERRTTRRIKAQQEEQERHNGN